MTKEDEDLLQYLVDQLQEGYSEYKRKNPDFARFVEEQLEGKPEQKDKNHCCTGCGEWLEGFDQCSQCGRINKSGE